MPRAIPKATLLNPPFTDPTMPPNFAAYLVGAARHNGFFDTNFIDLNAILHNHMFDEDFFCTIKQLCTELISKSKRGANDSLLEVARYRLACNIASISFSELLEAKLTLKDPSRFYNYSLYKNSVSLIEAYVGAISAPWAPGAMRFGDINYDLYGDITSIRNLSNPSYQSLFLAPFLDKIGEILERIRRSAPEVVGISCNYISQLPSTIYLAHAIQNLLPKTILVVGGTEISDLYKNLADISQLRNIFDQKVVVIIGEGESAFVQVLRDVSVSGVGMLEHKNIIRTNEKDRRQAFYFENIDEIGSPSYDIYDLDLYF